MSKEYTLAQAYTPRLAWCLDPRSAVKLEVGSWFHCELGGSIPYILQGNTTHAGSLEDTCSGDSSESPRKLKTWERPIPGLIHVHCLPSNGNQKQLFKRENYLCILSQALSGVDILNKSFIAEELEQVFAMLL